MTTDELPAPVLCTGTYLGDGRTVFVKGYGGADDARVQTYSTEGFENAIRLAYGIVWSDPRLDALVEHAWSALTGHLPRRSLEATLASRGEPWSKMAGELPPPTLFTVRAFGRQTLWVEPSREGSPDTFASTGTCAIRQTTTNVYGLDSADPRLPALIDQMWATIAGHLPTAEAVSQDHTQIREEASR